MRGRAASPRSAPRRVCRATLPQQAATLLLRAADDWYQQGAHRRGLQVIERALALDPDDATRLEALLLMAEGLVETRALLQARDVLAEVLERADSGRRSCRRRRGAAAARHGVADGGRPRRRPARSRTGGR